MPSKLSTSVSTIVVEDDGGLDRDESLRYCRSTRCVSLYAAKARLSTTGLVDSQEVSFNCALGRTGTQVLTAISSEGNTPDRLVRDSSGIHVACACDL